MAYPAAYHQAASHLVSFGAHGGDTAKGRRLVAKALYALRRLHGRRAARHERRHLLFISGMFPVKPAPHVCHRGPDCRAAD